MPKVSVIIPVYNTKKYLKQCLDSVVKQTLQDIEIICINDGSTDGSLDILNEYASKDNRIIVIDKQNEGVSVARNLGIEKATGEYLMFLDSDDFLESNLFYDRLYNVAVTSGVDIVKGNYKLESDGSVWEMLNEQIREDKNNFCIQFASAIYKTKFIKENNIEFPAIKDMEDPVFAFHCALCAQNILTVDDAYYIVVINPNSVTRSKINSSQIFDKITGLKFLIELANNANITSECYTNVIGLWFTIVFNDIFKNNNIFTRMRAISEMKAIYNNLNADESLEQYIKNNKCNIFIRTIKDLLQAIFSIKNTIDKRYKKITILGFVFKIKRSKR